MPNVINPQKLIQNDLLKTANNQKKGQTALSSNTGKSTVNPLRLAWNTPAAMKRSGTITDYGSDSLNEKYQSTVKMLYNLQQKTGSKYNVIEDAKDLMSSYIGTVKASHGLNSGRNAADYLRIGDNEFQRQLEQTIYKYQYGSMDAAGLEKELARKGYQTNGQQKAMTEQNVIGRAKEMGAGMTPEERRRADYLNALGKTARNPAWTRDAIEGSPNMGFLGMGQETNQSTPQSQNAALLRDMEQELRAKDNITLADAEKYLAGQGWEYGFAKEHPGDLSGYAAAFSRAGDIVNRAMINGVDKLTNTEKEVYYALQGNNGPELGAGLLGMGGMTNQELQGYTDWGRQQAAALQGVNGLYINNQPDRETQYILNQYRQTPEGAKQWAQDAIGTPEEEAARDNEYFVTNRAHYQDVAGRADFAEISQMDPSKLNSLEYARVNGQKSTAVQGMNPMPANPYGANLGTPGTRFNIDQMNEDERAMYNAIVNTEGFTAGGKYLDYLQYELDRRAQEQTAAETQQFAESGFLGGLGASVMGTGARLLQFAGYADILGQRGLQAINGALGRDYRPINWNGPAQLPGTISEAATQGVQNQVDLNVNIFGQDMDLFDFGYGTLMDAANSVLAGATGFGEVLLAGAAAQSGAQEAHKMGAPTDVALALGGLEGIDEGLFEHISLSKLYDEAKHIGNRTFKDFMTQIFAQAGINASEEYFTEKANMKAEEILLGDKDKYAREYTEYLDLGLTPEEAKQRIDEEKTWRLVQAAAGGLVMGAFFGGTSTAAGDIATSSMEKRTGKNFDLEERKALAELASHMPDGSARAMVKEWKDEKGNTLHAPEYNPEKATAKQTGKLFRTIMQELPGEMKGTLRGNFVLSVLNSFDGISKEAADAIGYMMSGEQLNSDQIEALAKDKAGMELVNDLFGVESGKKGQGQKAETEQAEAGPGTVEFEPMPGMEEKKPFTVKEPVIIKGEASKEKTETAGAGTVTAGEKINEAAWRENAENGNIRPEEQSQKVEQGGAAYKPREKRLPVMVLEEGTANNGSGDIDNSEAREPRTAPSAEEKQEQGPDGRQIVDAGEGTKGEGKAVMGFQVDEESGAVTAEMEDGSRQDVEELPISDAQKEIAQETAGMGAEAQGVIIRNYEGQDAVDYAQRYAKGMKTVYNEARNGKTLEDTRSLYAEDLTEEQRKAAWEAGQKAREADQALEREKTRQAQQDAQQRGYTFGVLDESNDGSDGNAPKSGVYLARVKNKLSGTQAAQLAVLQDVLSKKGIPVQIRVYDTMNDKNGSYVSGTNIINVALDAEGGLINRSVSHELFHFVKRFDPEAAATIQKFVIDILSKTKGYDLEKRRGWVRDKYKSSENRALTDDEIDEDLAADSMLDVFDTKENLEAFYKNADKSLIEKITDWIKDTVAKIRDAMARIGRNHPEVEAMRGNLAALEKIQNDLIQAAQTAGQNYLAARAGMNSQAAQDADVMAYQEEMGKAVTMEAAQEARNGLESKLFARYYADMGGNLGGLEYEDAFQRFQAAMEVFGSGESKSLAWAFNQAKLPAPKQGMNSVLSYAARQMAAGAREAASVKNGDGKERYSFKQDSEGPYVDIDVDQKQFDGLTMAEMQKKALQILRNKFVGKLFDFQGNMATMFRRSAKHYTFSEFPIDANKRETKMRGTTELENILKIGIFERSENDDGSHPEMEKWDYYNTRFKFGNSPVYEFEIKVGHRKTGETEIYDIYPSQKKGNAANNGPTTDVARRSPTVGSASDDIVSQQGNNVKERFSFKADVDYMAAAERGDEEEAQRMVDEAAKAAGYTTPKLYHGTGSFGFTEFDLTLGESLIFATSDRGTAETYSGETNRNRIQERIGETELEEIRKMGGEELLEKGKKAFDEYKDYELMNPIEKEAAIEVIREEAFEIAQRFNDFISDHDGAFDDKKMEAIGDIRTAIKKIAAAKTAEEEREAWDSYQNASFAFKWIDESLSDELWGVIGENNLYRDSRWLADMLAGDIYENKAQLGFNYTTAQLIRNKLEAASGKGIYEMYGRPGKQLVIDGEGGYWNAITPPEELGLYGPQKTRDIASAAIEKGYDSVLIKNLMDWGGATNYKKPSDIYIFFNSEDVKSADPITYDDAGNVIPLSERFNQEEKDIRYSFKADEADTSEESEALRKNAVSIFGKTYNWNVTGYVLPDGTRLDFSGKREGSSGQYREEDHREIKAAYGEDTEMSGTEAMIDFMRRGAIRIMPESGGIQLQTIPTKAQLQALDGFISKMRGEVIIDIDDENGNTIYSKEYDRGTFSRRIIGDIPSLFEEAQRSQSDTARFHEERYSFKADEEADTERQALEDVREDADLYAQAISDEFTMQAIDDFAQIYQAIERVARNMSGDGTQEGNWKKRTYEIANRLKTETGSTMSTKEAARWISRVFQAIDKGGYVSGEVLMYARDFGMELLKKAPGMEIPMDETTKEIRRIVKERGFYLTDDMKSEIAGTYGSVEDFRRKNFGKMRIVKQSASTPSLAEVWTEDLSRLNPGVFAEDTVEADMPRILDGWLETSGEKKYTGEFGTNATHYATSIALELMMDYLDAPWSNTRIKNLTARYDRNVKRVRTEYQNKYEERMSKDKERKEVRERKEKIISSIRQNARYINTRVMNPKNTRHIPEEYRGAAEAFVYNLYSDRAIFSADEAREYALKYAKWASDEKLHEIKGLSPQIQEELGWLAQNVTEDTPLRKMTEEQLNKVDHIVGNFRKIIEDGNSVFMNGKQQDLDTLVGSEMAALSKRADAKNGTLREASRKFFTKELTPIYYAKRVGGVVESGIREFIEKQSDYIFKDKAAKAFYEEAVRLSNVNGWLYDKPLEMTTKQGDKIILTKNQAMSLYAWWKRETSNSTQSAEHLRLGGFTYDTSDKDTRNLKGVDLYKPHIMMQEDFEQISDYLSQVERDFADKLVDYLSNDVAAWCNEMSMRMYGYNQFEEKYYFPYPTDPQYRSKGLTQEQRQKQRLYNWGGAKPLTEYARNPLKLQNFTDLWLKHVNEAAMYSTYAEAIQNLDRVTNYVYDGESMYDEQGNLHVTPPTSLKKRMEQAYGREAVQYLETLLDDLNGGVRNDDRTGWSKATSLFKKGSVAANLSVVLQQPSAFVRAMSMVNPKYFAKALTPSSLKNVKARMYENSGAANIKDMGRFDTNVGKSAEEWMGEAIKPESRGERIYNGMDKWTGMGAEIADEITWCYMYAAVENEIADNTDLERGTEAFNQAAGRRFDEVMTQTQVYDSTLAKSEYMRGTGEYTKMLTSFMAEPTMTANMLINAAWDVMEKKPGAKKAAAVTLGVFVGTAFVNALLKSFATAFRRTKDEDKGRTYWEKYLAEAAGNFADDVNPFGIAGMLPVARDIVSLAQGYDVERADMSIAADLIKYLTKAMKADSSAADWLNLAGAAGNMFGIPARNVIRDVSGIWKTFFGGAADKDSTSDKALLYVVLENIQIGPWSIWDSSRAAYYDRMEEALKARDMDRYNELRGYMEETLQVKPDTVTSGIKDEIKKSFTGGLISDDKAMELLEQLGMDRDKAFNAVDGWAHQEQHAGEEDYNYTVYEDLNSLVKQGGDLKAEIDQLTGAGIERKNIDKAVKSEIKREYQAGEITERQAQEKLKKYLGLTDSKKLYSTVNEWEYKKDDPDRTGYNQYQAAIDAAREGKALTGAMKELTWAGYAEKDVKSAVLSEIRKWYKDGEITRAQTESKMKQYAGLSGDDLYWEMDKLDYQKKNPSGEYQKYGEFYKAVETGSSLQATVKRYLDHGVKKDTMSDQITRQYKSQYVELYRTNKTKAAELKARLLTAYAALGYDRSKKQKDIDKWVK